MSALARDEQDKNKAAFWGEKAVEADKKGVHTLIIIPNVLKDVCHIREGYTYEK